MSRGVIHDKISNMKPKFIDHILIIVKDVKKTEEFYSKILGKPIHKDEYSLSVRTKKLKNLSLLG